MENLSWSADVLDRVGGSPWKPGVCLLNRSGLRCAGGCRESVATSGDAGGVDSRQGKLSIIAIAPVLSRPPFAYGSLQLAWSSRYTRVLFGDVHTDSQSSNGGDEETNAGQLRESH